MVQRTFWWVIRLFFLALIVGEILGVAGVLSWVDERVWPGVLLMSIVTWVVLEVADRWLWRRLERRLPLPVIMAVLIAMLIDVVGGVFNLYDAVHFFDLLVHGASGAAITVFFFFLLRSFSPTVVATWFVSYVAWSSMVVLAVLFELGEWVADSVYDISFWLGSGQDTLSDLLAAMVGGGMMLLVVWYVLSRQER